MAKIRVAQVGCGSRGLVHIQGWLAQPERFELVALCELDAARMGSAVAEFGLEVAQYGDADRMLAETRPDLFCFVTRPDVRVDMVELAATHRVRGLAFEKPMALSLVDARRIVALCRGAGIKATLCQQHIYTSSFLRLKQILDAGDIGRPVEIHATTTGNLFDRGTHYTHYLLWAGGFAQPQWVVGQVHGRGQLHDIHPSPDHCLVRLQLDGGVYGLGEYGAAAPRYDSGDVWQVNRLTVHGTHGTVWAENSGIWGCVSRATKGSWCAGRTPPTPRTESGRRLGVGGAAHSAGVRRADRRLVGGRGGRPSLQRGTRLYRVRGARRGVLLLPRAGASGSATSRPVGPFPRRRRRVRTAAHGSAGDSSAARSELSVAAQTDVRGSIAGRRDDLLTCPRGRCEGTVFG